MSVDELTDLPLVLTVPEVAKVLRISTRHAYEEIQRGGIPHVKMGRLIRVPRHQLEALLGIDETSELPSIPTPLRSVGS